MGYIRCQDRLFFSMVGVSAFRALPTPANCIALWTSCRTVCGVVLTLATLLIKLFPYWYMKNVLPCINDAIYGAFFDEIITLKQKVRAVARYGRNDVNGVIGH